MRAAAYAVPEGWVVTLRDEQLFQTEDEAKRAAAVSRLRVSLCEASQRVRDDIEKSLHYFYRRGRRQQNLLEDPAFAFLKAKYKSVKALVARLKKEDTMHIPAKHRPVWDQIATWANLGEPEVTTEKQLIDALQLVLVDRLDSFTEVLQESGPRVVSKSKDAALKKLIPLLETAFNFKSGDYSTEDLNMHTQTETSLKKESTPAKAAKGTKGKAAKGTKGKAAKGTKGKAATASRAPASALEGIVLVIGDNVPRAGASTGEVYEILKKTKKMDAEALAEKAISAKIGTPAKCRSVVRWMMDKGFAKALKH